MPSFDVVSQVDMQEVTNALDQARREIGQRYDFRDTDTEIELKDGNIVLNTVSEQKAQAAIDVIQTKLIRRNVPIKNLDYGSVQPAAGGRVKQEIAIQQGIDQDRAKTIAKHIKGLKMKVQASIQGDSVRVSGKKRDDLQAVIADLRENDFGVALQYVNFRD